MLGRKVQILGTLSAGPVERLLLKGYTLLALSSVTVVRERKVCGLPKASSQIVHHEIGEFEMFTGRPFAK